MDLFLIQNCENLINEVQTAVNWYGANDVQMDPGYCVFGACSQDYLNKWIEDHKNELEKCWEFAITWDINENEFIFKNETEKVLFLIQYLASYCEDINEA